MPYILGRSFPSSTRASLSAALTLVLVCAWPARLQLEVSDVLSALGIPHTVEARVEHASLGPATVDILIEQPGQPPLVLEVDGPSHFMALPPYQNLGHTALRNRLLKARWGPWNSLYLEFRVKLSFIYR